MFIYGSLNPVGADLHHRDKAVVARSRCGGAALVNALDYAVDPAGHFRVFNIALQLFDLRFLHLNVQFLVLEGKVLLLDLDRIVGLFGGGGVPLLFLQLRDRFLCAVIFVVQAFEVDLRLFQVFFVLSRIINKEDLALFHFVAFPDVDLFDVHFAVLGHRPRSLGLDDA